MKSYIIPLGMRCTAVELTNTIVNQPRFPFDWTQMSVKSMCDVIHLEAPEIKSFWTDYFSSVDDTKHTKSGSWFAHDDFTDKSSIIDKYCRRTERLQSVLQSKTHVTYVIVFGFPEQDSIEKVLELAFVIRCHHQGPCSFIVCNGTIQEGEEEDMIFLYEKLEEDWEDLKKRLEHRIRKIIEQKQIEPIPFEWRKLQREGYGSEFNDLYIEGDFFIKVPKNEYGKKKLLFEMEAYVVFMKDVPSFPLAKFEYVSPEIFRLHYYRDSIPLWKFYKSVSVNERDTLLYSILHHLQNLHNTKQKTVSKEEFSSLLRQETLLKLKDRYSEIKHILDQYPFSKVNGLPCLSFDECIHLVEEETYKYIEKKSEYQLCYIHGDPQFNNILIDPLTKQMVFLDPRGYFGDSLLFGIEEYDTAKVLFALSGYDIFDSTKDFTISIEENNITIPDFTIDERYISLYPEIHFLLASIWLANSHCFIQNPQKAVVSHAIARLLATRLMR